MTRMIKVPKGTKFGRFTVIAEAEPKFERTTGKMIRFFKVRCECGSNPVKVRLAYLRNGSTVSCGCFHRENQKNLHTKHGLFEHELYNIHKGMVRRCTNELSKDYSYYGGRGIKVCKDWLEPGGKGLQNFIKWNESLPESKRFKIGLSIERCNNDGDYEPDNCKWTTRAAQNKNKSTKVVVVYEGAKIGLNELYEKIGNKDIPFKTVYHRYHIKKWEAFEAVTLPKYGKPSARRA